MKRLLLPLLALPSFLLFTMGCGEKPPETVVAAPPVRLKPNPKVYRAEDLRAEEAAREAAIAREIAELEAEAEQLRQEIDREQLAMDRAALEEEQRRLDQERTAWQNEQMAAAARIKPANPVSVPVSPPAVPPPVRDYSYFYSELSSQGSWFQSLDYGYVWQPAVARQTSWRPYTVGRWAACDRGWTWLSDEPFGWAVYHYGRWTKLKDCGWIWVPGEVWAPAWVAWRRSDQFVGWCPLPPETLYREEVTYDASIDQICGLQPSSYIFITVKQFCLPVHLHGEPAGRSVLVCRDTRNITRLRVSRERVDCSGPLYDWIKDRQTQPPARYILTCDWQPGADRAFRIERDKLCVFSPVMRAPWNPGLRPREVAGPLPVAAVPEGIKVPDKIKNRFREDKKNWLAASVKTLQGESSRRVAERQARVEALTAAVADGRLPLPPAGSKSEAAPAGPSLAQQRSRRDQVKQEVAARQVALAEMRGLPTKITLQPNRISAEGGPAVRREVPREVSATVRMPLAAAPPGSPTPVETPAAGAPEEIDRAAGSAAAIVAGVPPGVPDKIVTEAPLRRDVQAELEARRAEVERLKEAQAIAVRQRQQISPPRQEVRDPDIISRPQASNRQARGEEKSRPALVSAPEAPAPQVPMAEPPPESHGEESLPQATSVRREAAAALVERQEKAARIHEELTGRQQAQQQQRLAFEREQAVREPGQAQAAAEAARQLEMEQVAQQNLAAGQEQQVAADRAARRQELMNEAARQPQARLAEQTGAAMDRQQQEAEAARQELEAERAQLAEQALQEQAARQQAQRQAAEQARQEEMARQQQEAAQRAQQEQAAREAAQRQAEEQARQAEMALQQQEAAQRAQQEQAAREAAQRQAEERARQEEMARQQREAAERAQQEQAAREAAQRQAEERARAAAEAAKNGNQ